MRVVLDPNIITGAQFGNPDETVSAKSQASPPDLRELEAELQRVRSQAEIRELRFQADLGKVRTVGASCKPGVIRNEGFAAELDRVLATQTELAGMK